MPRLATHYAHSIELRHLRYFAAVAEEHQFTRAAARLHLAQPPLSAQVRQLEQRLGATLLERAPGRVSLTPAGEALLEAVERTFAALDDGIRAVEAIAAGRRGRARVALGPTVPVQPALDAIARTRTAAPELHVELARAADPERVLLGGEADVALLWGPPRERALWSAVVAVEQLNVVLAARHRLARCARVVLEDLRGEPLLEPQDAHLGIGEPAGSPEDLLARVAAGDALAVVPEGVARGLESGIAAAALADAPPASIVIAHRGEHASACALTFTDAALGATSQGAAVAA